MAVNDLNEQEDPPEFPTDNSLAGESSEEQVRALCEWFHWNFEDPANETPYESSEGGYIYIWGGPYDALEQLSHRFEGVVGLGVVEAAVQQVESGGYFFWAPAGRTIMNPDEFDDVEIEIKENRLTEKIRKALDDVEAAARKVNARRGGIGHNHPPEPIDDIAYSRENEAQLFTSTRNIRNAVESDDTTEDHVEKDRKALVRICHKIARWLATKINRASDAFASTVGAAAGVALVDLLVDLEQKIGGLVRLLEQLF